MEFSHVVNRRHAHSMTGEGAPGTRKRLWHCYIIYVITEEQLCCKCQRVYGFSAEAPQSPAALLHHHTSALVACSSGTEKCEEKLTL
eukprot:4432799-Ditylum_brightwellii.AAC.1